VGICCVLEKSKRHRKERESYPFLTEDTKKKKRDAYKESNSNF
jgi:hypothetical protein